MDLLQVALKANKVISTKTPLQYEYYDLPFCKRRKTKSKAENLGERLAGDSVTTSPYQVGFHSSFVFLFFKICFYSIFFGRVVSFFFQIA